MRKLVLTVFILSTITFSQTKYLIYFKDKGINPDQRLSKTSLLYQESLNHLSKKCIERRIKNMGEDNIITYEDIPIKSEYITQLKNSGIKIVNKLNWFNAVSAYLTSSQKNQISDLSFVKIIEPVRTLWFKDDKIPSNNYLYKTVSDNPYNYGASYDQLSLCNIPIVQRKGITGDSVIIGILDTGFRWKDHESLDSRKVLAEYDFVFHDSITANQSGDVPGQDSHGTYVFSIVGGFKDSSMIGASFNSSFILSKTEDIRSETHVEEDNYAAALEWMEGLGVDITTSSLGYNIFDDSTYSYSYSDMNGNTTIITKAINLAFNRGVVTLSAAGNEGNTSWHYIDAPADAFNVLAVGAVDRSNIVAGFSSRGPTFDGRIKPDVTALGVSVYGASTAGFNLYNYASGTSAATPIAAGVAGLLLSAHSYLKNTQVRSILIETAGNSESPNNDIGYGLLSAVKAVNFPNLEKLFNNVYRLHKTFISDHSVNPNTVKLYYSTDQSNFTENSLLNINKLNFAFDFPILPDNNQVDFYFTFSDSTGVNYREPSNNYYKFLYGQLDVAFNLELKVPFDYGEVSDVYPNPYMPLLHTRAKLNYKASKGENVSVNIIDAVGQSVRELNYKAGANNNIIEWDGKNNKGETVASGVYFFLIKIGNNKYGKKVVLLK